MTETEPRQYDVIIIGETLEGAAATYELAKRGLTVGWMSNDLDRTSLWSCCKVDFELDGVLRSLRGEEALRVLLERLAQMGAEHLGGADSMEWTGEWFRFRSYEALARVVARAVIVTSIGREAAELPECLSNLLNRHVTLDPIDLRWFNRRIGNHVAVIGSRADAPNAVCVAHREGYSAEVVLHAPGEPADHEEVVGAFVKDRRATLVTRRGGTTRSIVCDVIVVCRGYVPSMIDSQNVDGPAATRIERCGYLTGMDRYDGLALWREGLAAADRLATRLRTMGSSSQRGR